MQQGRTEARQGTRRLCRTGRHRQIIAEVLHICHSHLAGFSSPVLLWRVGAVVTLVVRLEVFDIARQIPPGPEALRYKAEIVEIWSASLVRYLLTWIAFCFSFGAIL